MLSLVCALSTNERANTNERTLAYEQTGVAMYHMRVAPREIRTGDYIAGELVLSITPTTNGVFTDHGRGRSFYSDHGFVNVSRPNHIAGERRKVAR